VKRRSPHFRLVSGASRTRHGTTITVVWRLRQLRVAARSSRLSEAWAALWETDPPACPLWLGKAFPWPRSRRPALALSTSFLFHFSVVFFLASIPFSVLLRRYSRPIRGVETRHTRLVVYEFRRLSLPDYLPVVQPSAAGGMAGQGVATRPRVWSGSTRFDPRITIVSSPPHPDNFRQLIRNVSASWGLKSPTGVRVPDLILGGADWTEKPSPKAMAPAPTPSPPLEPASEPPAPAPVQQSAQKAASPAGKNPSASATRPPNTKAATTVAAKAEKHPGSPKLITLSVDPIRLKDMGSLPLGNREGAFSIGPTRVETGSPGGVAGAPPGVGEGGPGRGGEKSVAAGSGSARGEGLGSSITSPVLSVNGRAGLLGIPAGTLSPLAPEALVYPVSAAALKLRVPAVVVSSGPGGGGGLRVYGVLHAEKIYTIFLPMPGRNWVLQYCAQGDPPTAAQPSRVVEMHQQTLLAPPRALDQFDFHRPPADQAATDATIILHGLIRADGVVENLEVLHGLDPTLNSAALAAFGRWKFAPALRAGNPVAVEILVGIPAAEPGG
jgi:hypothetical protein